MLFFVQYHVRYCVQRFERLFYEIQILFALHVDLRNMLNCICSQERVVLEFFRLSSCLSSFLKLPQQYAYLEFS